MQHLSANVNGITLHYATEGAGKLILFLHGFPEFWYAWKAQLDEFGKDHQAVAPDLRGFNLSSKPADAAQYKARILIEDVRGLIEQLGHRRCILVAHDWGGALAWGLAAAYPQYVEKLIIINSPHPATFARELLHNQQQQAASEYMNLFRTDAAEEVLAADNFARLFAAYRTWGGEPWMMEQDRAAYLQAWSQPGALTGGLNYYRATPVHPPQSAADREALAAIAAAARRFTVTVPTLVIWGERDSALLPCLLDGLADYVSKLTIQRIPDASHWVVHEKPDQVNRLIRAFIETE
jgi:pimeloyl-ACP methyl ester carboxylesterase